MLKKALASDNKVKILAGDFNTNLVEDSVSFRTFNELTLLHEGYHLHNSHYTYHKGDKFTITDHILVFDKEGGLD